MTVRPIIFSTTMVRAMLDGHKTMTRRAIRFQPSPASASHWGIPANRDDWYWPTGYGRGIVSNKPGPHPDWVKAHVHHTPGDLLWVREGFAPRYFDNGAPGFRADWNSAAASVAREPKWKPSIHMPRAISRLTLEVVAVRVERLQSISEEDARAEGVESLCGEPWLQPNDVTHRRKFQLLWDHINGPTAWEANPWVVAISFTVRRGNVDQIERDAA